MFRKPFTPHSFHQKQRFNRFGHKNNIPNRFVGPEFIHKSRYVNKSQTHKTEEVVINKHAFADFQIDDKLKQNIITHGYTDPTPIQDQAIEPILEGKDVVGIANTGTGKTAAFLIPLIDKIMRNRSEKALIMIPTRELAVQIAQELSAFAKGLDIKSVVCIGGANMQGQMQSLRRNPSIIIATPGRLKDLVQRRLINLQLFKTIILDEVDRMLDIGFVHEIKFIISLLPPIRQSLFFSATVSTQINTLIQSFTKEPLTISVKVKETAEHIDQDIIRISDKNEKLEKLASLLKQEEFKKVLVFGRTKWGVEKLSKKLQQQGFSVDSIHGNKSQNQRIRVLNLFKENRLQVLVATDVAARGLDIESVSHVINFDEPATMTDYIHRIGRTGRAEKSGKALTFVG